jgi:hypothetical protein
MSQIIDELLLLSGVRRMTVEPRPFQTADAVREARERLTLLIRERAADIVMPGQWPESAGLLAVGGGSLGQLLEQRHQVRW